jgi:hypothetical protein
MNTPSAKQEEYSHKDLVEVRFEWEWVILTWHHSSNWYVTARLREGHIYFKGALDGKPFSGTDSLKDPVCFPACIEAYRKGKQRSLYSS